MKRITIIGGGASGTLLAINLLKYDGERRMEINLVEKRSGIGRGVAFSTEHDVHLLNVPAAKMGAFPDDIEHFHKWLNENGHACEPSSFVPRKLFGQYLRENLEAGIKNKSQNVSLNIFDDEAVDIAFDDSKAQVILKSGDILYSEKVALAFGNFLPPHPSIEDQSFIESPKYFQDPWNHEVFERIRPGDSVFIIGTGLSMVDIVMQFNKKGHSGPINAISTRGLLPAVHKLGFTYPSFYDEIKPFSRITDLLKSVRRHAEKASANGSDWRAVIDSLRPVTQEIWLNLPLAEKRYFMQHLSRYWNVARHRMPGEAAAVLDEMKNTGRLNILKGRLRQIKADQQFEIKYRTDGVENRISADAVINCIGSETKFDFIESQLIKNLLPQDEFAATICVRASMQCRTDG